MDVDVADRVFVARYGQPTFTLVTYKNGVLADADGNLVTADLVNAADGATISSGLAATRTDVGTYEITLASTQTDTVRNQDLVWSYSLDGTPQTYRSFMEVGTTSPAYDGLSVGFRGIIESVWSRFADLFDSPEGGPHLLTYYQSHFGRGRLAQLLTTAVGKLNTAAQPYMTYSTDETRRPFPYEQWGALLDQALYIEVIKHLIRSYVEIPSTAGVPVAYLDRRDYMDRWRTVLDMEMREFEAMFDTFKIAHMGLGRPRALVAGGIYPNWGIERLPILAARPRYLARVYG